MVKRYELDAFDRLTVKEGGYLVYYEDYQALEAERGDKLFEQAQQLEAENELLTKTILAVKKEYRQYILWIIRELAPDIDITDRDSLIQECIDANTTEMP